jgi:hypothetical protein
LKKKSQVLPEVCLCLLVSAQLLGDECKLTEKGGKIGVAVAKALPPAIEGIQVNGVCKFITAKRHEIQIMDINAKPKRRSGRLSFSSNIRRCHLQRNIV